MSIALERCHHILGEKQQDVFFHLGSVDSLISTFLLEFGFTWVESLGWLYH